MAERLWSSPIGERERRILSFATLLVMATLILARLSMYALWDDEANTALFGRGVWRTGDTSGDLAPNVVAYGNGLELDAQLRNRVVAPLPYYFESIFVRETRSELWARIPFALVGIGAIAFALWWLGRTNASRGTWALGVLALVGNVSYILFCRQARYYALAIGLSMVLTYVYAHRERGRWAVAWLSVIGALLLATHYLAYAGMAAALGCDYLIWGRKTAKLSVKGIATIAGTHLVVGLPIVLTWLPFAMTHQHAHKGLADHLGLWFQTLRDLNNCEYGAGLVMLVAPLLYRRTRDPLLLRLPLAILVATLVVTVFSPQRGDAGVADIRYSCFLIPACLWLCVRAVDALRVSALLSLLVGVLVFQTTLVHRVIAQRYPTWGYEMPVRNTLVAYLGELVTPPPSAYRLAADWLAAHAHEGESALVLPDYAVYPLMFHVPEVVYAWQLTADKAAEFPQLAPIQFWGKLAPEWVVAFVRFEGSPAWATLADSQARYERAVELPATGVDLSRPELFWHRFDASTAYHPRAPLTIWRRIDSR